MRSLPVVAFGILSLHLATASAAVVTSYVPINDTHAIITGVRSTSATSDSVVLTANYTTGGIQYAGLYEGSLAAATSAPTSSWNTLTPVITGQTVTAATFYGPNTPRFDPTIGAGNVVAVGSYKYSQASSPLADHGILYIGPVTGVNGTWKQIDATPLVTGIGETLKNTIAHSNMGELVVGNYDTDLATGKAFIYNRITDTWTNLKPNNTSVSFTAYGIWQNGGPTSTKYTIAGGYSDVNDGGVDQSYLVNYDSFTHQFSDYRTYNFNNLPPSAALCHFDGITQTSTGFNLTGFVTNGATVSAFFASVPVNGDGSFGSATWTAVAYPSAPNSTTGNTIVDNKVLGIFITAGSPPVTQSYLATVEAERTSVTVKVTKTRARATYTIANTGNLPNRFALTRSLSIRTRHQGPRDPSVKKPTAKVTFTLKGQNVTKAIANGNLVTASLDPGASVNLIETAKAPRRKGFTTTIKTTVKATGKTAPAKSAQATATLVLRP